MAKKEKKQKVWVASYRFEDRHGPEGMGIIGVFTTKKKAQEACGDNIEMYLREFEAIDDNGKVNDTICSIDGDTAEGVTLEDARNAESINVDDDGTWCEWSIDEAEVE